MWFTRNRTVSHIAHGTKQMARIVILLGILLLSAHARAEDTAANQTLECGAPDFTLSMTFPHSEGMEVRNRCITYKISENTAPPIVLSYGGCFSFFCKNIYSAQITVSVEAISPKLADNYTIADFREWKTQRRARLIQDAAEHGAQMVTRYFASDSFFGENGEWVRDSYAIIGKKKPTIFSFSRPLNNSFLVRAQVNLAEPPLFGDAQDQLATFENLVASIKVHLKTK